MLHTKKDHNFEIKPFLALLSILSLVLLSRIFIFDYIFEQSPSSLQRNDTIRYEQPALQLLDHGTLAVNPQAPNTTTLSTTPVYSLLIAAVYKASGYQNQYLLIIVQILISTLLVYSIYLIASQLWTKKIGLTAALLMTMDPLQILYSQLMLSEMIFSFFLALSLLSFINLVNKHNKIFWALALGALLTTTTMTKPISYYLVFAIVFGLFIFKREIFNSWREFFLVILLILLPFMVITNSWKSRNEELTGVYALNNALSETLLYFKARGVLMTGKSLDRKEAKNEILNRLPSDLDTPKKQAAAETKLAKEIILADPFSYLKLSAKGAVNFILGIGLSGQALYYDIKDRGKYISQSSKTPKGLITKIEEKTGYKFWYLGQMLYSTFFILSTYILVLFGFYYAIKKSTPKEKINHLFLLGVFIYFLLISIGHIDTDSRMRTPVIPILLLYAAYGINIIILKKVE
jgi:4-amino-4-deoxy-L-arabinose transferase-like glycosyltransferase